MSEGRYIMKVNLNQMVTAVITLEFIYSYLVNRKKLIGNNFMKLVILAEGFP